MEAVVVPRGVSRTREEGCGADQPRAAFSALVREHDGALRVLAYRMLGSADEMDDVLQDVYLKAYRTYREFRGDSAPRTWLYRITYNACVDRLRRRRTDTCYLEDVAETGYEPPSRDDVEGSAQMKVDVQRALTVLTDDQRAAVLLVDALGWEYTEAAEVLGLPKGTIGSRLHRARAALRHALGQRGEVI